MRKKSFLDRFPLDACSREYLLFLRNQEQKIKEAIAPYAEKMKEHFCGVIAAIDRSYALSVVEKEHHEGPFEEVALKVIRTFREADLKLHFESSIKRVLASLTLQVLMLLYKDASFTAGHEGLKRDLILKEMSFLRAEALRIPLEESFDEYYANLEIVFTISIEDCLISLDKQEDKKIAYATAWACND